MLCSRVRAAQPIPCRRARQEAISCLYTLQAPGARDLGTRARASLRVQQALEGITRLSKGFSLPLCTRSRPKIGELLQQALQTALQIPPVCLRPCCVSTAL